MAKKRNNTPKLSPTIIAIGTVVILILGAFGVQTPDFVKDIFEVDQPKQSQKYRPKNNNSSKKEAPIPKEGQNPGIIENGNATFTADELKNSSKGWIEYHSVDQYDRPTGADALITPKMINTGTKANPDVRPPGFISGLDPYNHSRGHIIGRQLGGSGDEYKNLVTIYQNPVNTPMMTKYENMVRAAADKGKTIRYRVYPVYEGDEPLPTEIRMEGQSLDPQQTINFNITILNQK
ncbi:DNA/RNA non-specific endonuclease [Vagococcus intermedius]|uniref:DNA/RNA non-specific endonuclease n=1 Tax=Vagococcus intermedius TaxID=2991418 RepID=A0AAF0I9X1_9ENTE|nr:DNA/RNA non-specific endonuclease [Vagococcus intermedius]WEG73877.1 DNA/RNA non-specific endonuclease [Vagococcus intermedius]WEG75962.1 DNA/RNA non-specific endonuclease [Vagococcus intermedius]